MGNDESFTFSPFGYGNTAAGGYTNYSVFAPQHEVNALRRRIVALETDNVWIREALKKLEDLLEADVNLFCETYWFAD